MNESTALNHQADEPRTARPIDVAAIRGAAVAVARQLIARDGAGRLTLDTVAHAAGLSTGALAKIFDNEQELLMAIAADDLATLARSMRGSTASPLPGARELIHQVATLETSFGNIIDRHQKTLRQRNDMSSWVEECVKDLQQQVEFSDRAFAEMRSEVKAALATPASKSAPLAASPLPAKVAAKVAHLIVEPPLIAVPLSMSPPAETRQPAEAHQPAEARYDDLPPLLDPQPQPQQPATSNSEEGVLMDNYLLEARRAAIATQAGTERHHHQAQRRSKRTRVVAAAVLGPLAILATAAMVLNRNGVTAMPSMSGATEPQLAELVPNPVEVPPAKPEPQVIQQAAPAPAPQVATAQPAATPAPAQLATAAPIEKLTELASTGDAKAERDLGLKYLAGDGVQPNENEAARWLMRAAYRGEPTAEFWLATLYARGHGVPEDAFQANHWYEAAAKKGNRRAMHSFAVAYFQGWGVEKNYSEAARWFRSAAELGFVDSQFNLASLYERGAGLPQSLTEAYKWYAIAAKGGDKESGTRVGVLATQLSPADLALAQQAAASFKPTAMDQDANLGAGREPAGG